MLPNTACYNFVKASLDSGNSASEFMDFSDKTNTGEFEYRMSGM